MAHLSTITSKQAKELANLAFVYAADRRSYKSKNWKLYKINDHEGKFKKIIIVDEHVPLGSLNKNPYPEFFKEDIMDYEYVEHHLWSKDYGLKMWSSNDPGYRPIPLYNWIEIDLNYCIRTEKVFTMDMSKYIVEDSQYNIFKRMEDFDLI